MPLRPAPGGECDAKRKASPKNDLCYQSQPGRKPCVSAIIPSPPQLSAPTPSCSVRITSASTTTGPNAPPACSGPSSSGPPPASPPAPPPVDPSATPPATPPSTTPCSPPSHQPPSCNAASTAPSKETSPRPC